MPRIYDNGTYRDMTTEEIAELENQSSGGAELLVDDWRLINEITTTEDVISINITKDIEGNPFELKKIMVISKVRGNSSSLTGWIAMRPNNNSLLQSNWSTGFAKTEGQDYYYTNRTIAEIFGNIYTVLQNVTSSNNTSIKDSLGKYSPLQTNSNNNTVDSITSINIMANGASIGAGTQIKVYGK